MAALAKLQGDTAPSRMSTMGRPYGSVGREREAGYCPVFRYFDVLDDIGDLDLFTGLARVNAWRHELGRRDSVKAAVTQDYLGLLRDFIRRRESYLSQLMSTGEAKKLGA